MEFSPKRTCVVCRKKEDKHNLIRIVEQNELFNIDENQKLSARGFYVCASIDCVDQIVKRRVLSRLKKTNVAEQKHIELQNLLYNYINRKC